MLFLDEEERYRINVFDWNAEFPDRVDPAVVVTIYRTKRIKRYWKQT
jgi:hypothetical protein